MMKCKMRLNTVIWAVLILAGSHQAPAMATLTKVSASSFIMGPGTGESGDADEYPVRTIMLDTFYIDVHEASNASYAVVLNYALDQGYLRGASGEYYNGGDVYASGRLLLNMSSTYCLIGYDGSAFLPVRRSGVSMSNHPVVMVTWYGAAMYCNWLSETEGLETCYDTATWELNKSRNGYRMPTEAEWERAAAWDAVNSGHQTYAFLGETIDFGRANYYNGDSFNDPLSLNSTPRTAPVGYFNGVNVGQHGATVDASSPAGCYDMSGNVWEWVHDVYGPYSPSDVTNPIGPASGTLRVRRGGGWGSLSASCRTANRDYYEPDKGNVAVGFRICKSGKNALSDFPEAWVDAAWTGAEAGTESQPFNTLTEAVAALADGGIVRVKGNTGRPNIAETPRITKTMRIEAIGGPVRIGEMNAPAGGGLDLGLFEVEQDIVGTDAQTFVTMAEESDTFVTSSKGTMSDFDDPISTPNLLTPGTKYDQTPPEGTPSIPGPSPWAMMVLAVVFIALGATETRRRYSGMK